MAQFNRSKIEIENKLNDCINKTLGEIDINHAFDKTINHPKVTGIAGDVIEKSVLGYPSNSDQEPDLIVDGIPTEVKTTGIRYSTKALKKSNKKKISNKDFEAKEPMSITAVSPGKIINENFNNSNFWHKLNHMLLVYYHYNSAKTVKSWEYKNFPIKGFEFHEFSNEDKEILKNDWKKVKGFIVNAQKNYPNPESCYPNLGSDLRKKLLYIDTAPKWPNNPRFRLKRSFVTNIVQSYFTNSNKILSKSIKNSDDLDNELHKLTRKYKNLTVNELLNKLNINYKLNKKNDVSKSITEQIVVKMFGAKASKLSSIDVFNKAGIQLKTITITKKSTRTEDTKLSKIDFEQLKSEKNFENSEFYNCFAEKQFLFIIFEEPSSNSKRFDKKFIGFKRLTFSDDFIYKDVKKAWNHTRNLILNNKLREKVMKDKNNKIIINKNGTKKTRLNFIKSSENSVFLRGSGKNSSDKPECVNNIHMYHQYIWIKGSDLVSMLNDIPFI